MKSFSCRNYYIQTILFFFVSYIMMVNTACGSLREKSEESLLPSTITLNNYQETNATRQYSLSPTTTSSSQIITKTLSPTKIPTASLWNYFAWENHGPYGGFISSIAIDPIHPNILYAGVDSKNGGIWKSNDSGTNWKRSDEGILSPSMSFYYGITTLVIDSKTPSTLYAGIDQSGIFRSIDSGGHWEPIHNEVSGTRVKAMAVDPATSGTVFVGTLSGILKTIDGGNNWEIVLESDGSISDFISSITVDPTKTSIVYAGTTSVQGGEKSGIYKSIDGGNQWTFSNTGLENTDIQAIVIDPIQPTTLYAATIQMCGCAGGISENEGGIYRTIDGGLSWSRMIKGLFDVRSNSLAIDPLNHSTLYAGTFHGAYISTNGGNYWTEIPIEARQTNVQVFIIDPVDPSNIIMGTLSGVYKSTNSGISWIESNNGLSGAYIQALAVDPKRPTRLIASVWGKGLYESTDSGNEWNELFGGSIPLRFINYLAVDWSNPEILYAGSDYYGIFKSIDGGVSWRELKPDFSNPDALYRENDYNSVYTIVIDPVEPTTIYVGTKYGVFMSINGGDTWISLGTTEAWTIAIDPTLPKKIYAGNYKGLFKKTDDSQGWEELLVCPDCNFIIVVLIDPLHPNIIYVSDSRSIYKSLDSGKNWTSVLSGQGIFSITLDPVSTNTIYAATRNGILQSSNGGYDWVNIGLPGIDVFTLNVSRASPAVIHAGTTGGVYSIQLNRQ
jgi:photosystem II stability/assembly factor-like uncharacterized protein